MVISALTDSLGPGCIQMDKLEAIGAHQATQDAMVTADEKFFIPRVMDAYDMVESPEEHSIMTYASYFRDYLKNMQKKQLLQIVPGNCIAYGPGNDFRFCVCCLSFTTHTSPDE